MGRPKAPKKGTEVPKERVKALRGRPVVPRGRLKFPKERLKALRGRPVLPRGRLKVLRRRPGRRLQLTPGIFLVM